MNVIVEPITKNPGETNRQKIREFIQQEKRRWRMQEEREIAGDNWQERRKMKREKKKET